MQSKLICFVRASKFLVWVISLEGLLTYVKIKCSLSTPLRHIERVKVQLQSFVTSLLDSGGWLTSCPDCSSRGKQTRCPLNNSFWRTENPLPSTGSTLNYSTDLEIHSCETICTSVWSRYFCQVNCCNSAHITNLGVHLLQIKAYWRNASFEVTTADLSRFPIFSDVTLRRWIGSSRHSEETRGFFFFFIYPYCLASGRRFIAWKQFCLEPVSSYLLKSFLSSWTHLSHSPPKSSFIFVCLFFSLFWLPLPVLVFYNPAFLPHGYATVCFFFLYSLGLVLNLMFLWFYYFSIYPF
jgi:hypothetical protein